MEFWFFGAYVVFLELIGLLEADFESVNGIIENPAWQQSLKKANCVGYSMKDSGGKTIAKSIGNIPFTPIEVSFS